MHSSIYLALFSLAAVATAKTDLSGCTSSAVGPSLVYWVPETGEVCELLQCGGGRAPLKTTVPGCPAYEGTETYKPTYMPGYGPDGEKPRETKKDEETPAKTTSHAITSTAEHEESTPTPTHKDDEKKEETSTCTTTTADAHPTASSSTKEEESSTETETSKTTPPPSSKYTTVTIRPTGDSTLVTVGGNSTVSSATPSSDAFTGDASPMLAKTGREILGLAVVVLAGVIMF